MAEIWKGARWSPRGYLLYILPLPLIPAALFALLRGKVDVLLAEIGAMALLFGGAWLIRQGLKRETDERNRFTRGFPLKSVGTLATVAGVFVVSSLLVGQSILFAAI